MHVNFKKAVVMSIFYINSGERKRTKNKNCPCYALE